MKTVASAALFLALLVAGSGCGEEVPREKEVFRALWPVFHGTPHLDGLSNETLGEKLTLAWRFKTGGAVHSSAAIAAGRVFVGSDDGNLYALDLGTGREIWRFTTGGAVESSPAFLDDTVFFGSADQHLYAVTADRGELLWKYKTGAKILGGVNILPPEGDAEGRVLAGSYDSFLYCFSAATGDEIWAYESESYINGMAAVTDGMAVFGGCDALDAFDRRGHRFESGSGGGSGRRGIERRTALHRERP